MDSAFFSYITPGDQNVQSSKIHFYRNVRQYIQKKIFSEQDILILKGSSFELIKIE